MLLSDFSNYSSLFFSLFTFVRKHFSSTKTFLIKIVLTLVLYQKGTRRKTKLTTRDALMPQHIYFSPLLPSNFLFLFIYLFFSIYISSSMFRILFLSHFFSFFFVFSFWKILLFSPTVYTTAN